MKKTITFFCDEKFIKPMADEAKRRGYNVRYTNDFSMRCEIGIYFQHANWIEDKRAKFSVYMIHDLFQFYNIRPIYWQWEHWHNFDIAILPGKEMEDQWLEANELYTAHPRYGVYTLGWPKSDSYFNDPETIERVKKWKESLNLKYEKSILYAPSWEYENRETQFVDILQDMPVNLLIKHANYSRRIKSRIPILNSIMEQNAQIMSRKLENVYILDRATNIMDCLYLADLVVSEESSVMGEALLFDIPSIAVMDWKLPDCASYKLPIVPQKYIKKCTSKRLADAVTQMLTDEAREKVKMKKHDIVSNIGESSVKIMDLLDCFINNDFSNEIILNSVVKPVSEKAVEEAKEQRRLHDEKIKIPYEKMSEAYASLMYADVLNDWMYKKSIGFDFAEYFKENNWNSIAIFGTDNHTNWLCDELFGSEVSVKFIIDLEEGDAFYNNGIAIEIKPLSNFSEFNGVDVIVVSEFIHFDMIKEFLEKRVKCGIISLYDITLV